MEDFFGEFDDGRVEPEEYIEVGEHVLVTVTISGRGKQSGAAVRWNVFHAWTFENGTVTKGQTLSSREEAFHVLGPRE